MDRVQSREEDGNIDLRRGPWTVDEDFTLINYVAHHGEGRWNSVAQCAGLRRTGKSCRLRWLNYLRPDVRRGNITLEEQLLILELHSRWGNRWSKIAQHLPGRTDNEIKNYWRTRVQKHAKQLNCDVNSKQFKDAMRYLWMPRLVERIQASAASSAAATAQYQNPDEINQPAAINAGVDPTAFVSENSNSPVSDMTDCYNYAAGNQLANYVDHQPHQNLSSPTGYLNNGPDFDFDFVDQSGMWTDGGDAMWSEDDVWFLQQQFYN